MGATLERQFTVVRLGGALGARIDGLDLAEDLDDDVLARVWSELIQHCVLVFPKQGHLSPSEHSAFGRRLGELFSMPPPSQFVESDEAVLVVHVAAGAEARTD